MSTSAPRPGGVDIRLAEFLLQQLEVAIVRAIKRVEEIAEQRDGADQEVEDQITDHARLQPARGAEFARLEHEVRADAR